MAKITTKEYQGGKRKAEFDAAVNRHKAKKAETAKTTPKKEKAVEVSGPRLCLCGCGAQVTARKKRVVFQQGHDARLKGILLRVDRGQADKETIPQIAVPHLHRFKFTPDSLRAVFA